MIKPARLTAALLTALACAGCGQKGPLYLPGNPSEVRTEVPTTNASTVPEDEREEDDERPDDERQR